MEFELKDVKNIDSLAQDILKHFPDERIFLFFGKMGAGKTTLINALCRALEIADTPSSPTFSIVNEYHSDQGPVYHFDFYRLKEEEEALDLGYEEYFYSDNYCFVEWPEKIPNLLPDTAKQVHITALSPTHRKIIIK